MLPTGDVIKGLHEKLFVSRKTSQPTSDQLTACTILTSDTHYHIQKYLKYFSIQYFLQIFSSLLRHQLSAPAANSKENKQLAKHYRAVQASCSWLNEVLLYTMALTGHCHPYLTKFSNLMLILLPV